MTQDNVEVVRRAYEAFNARDWEGWLKYVDPAIDYRVFGVPESGSYEGHAEVGSYIELVLEGWDEISMEADEFIELDDDRVLVLGRQVSAGASTGLEVAAPFAAFGEFRNGLCVSVRHYHGMSRAEALETAGLPA